jgi:hypothetical protein
MSAFSHANPWRLTCCCYSALRAVRMGHINAKNASSATVDQLEGLGFEDEGGKSTKGVRSLLSIRSGVGASPISSSLAGYTLSQVSFEEHFGFPRPIAPAGSAVPTAPPALAPGAASSSDTQSLDAPTIGPFVNADGRLHRPSATICVHRGSAVTTEDKSLDLRVMFAKDFPITVSLTFFDTYGIFAWRPTF